MEGGGFLIFLIAMFAIMYLLVIRPQRNKQRAMQDLLSKVAPGDEIITIGGIYGDVVEVQDEKVIVEIAEDIQIEVARRAISQIIPQETYDEGIEYTADEGTEPEAVGASAGTHPAREERRFGVFGRRSS